MHAIRRSAAAFGALAAVSLLAAGPSAFAAAPAHASGEGIGRASATTARLGLDVKLLNSTVDIPVDVTLNSIQAPGDQDGSLLTATVAGVGHGPLSLVDAKVGHSSATADSGGSHAAVDLVDAQVNVPGLLGRGLLGIDAVHARADCPAGGQPSAQVNALGTVDVLGENVSLSAAGPTQVAVPGVGKVSLWLSRKTVTSHAAAATALELDVSINPLQLNVAQVTGQVVIAAVSCQEGAGGAAGGGAPSSGPADPSGAASATPPASGSAAPSASVPPSVSAPATAGAAPSGSASGAVTAQPAAATGDPTGTTGLAETGGGGDAPMIGGVALVLVGAGAGGVFYARRKRS